MEFPLLSLEEESSLLSDQSIGFENFINDRNNKELPHINNIGENYQSQGDNCATSSTDPSIDSCELNLQDIYELILNDANTLRREILKTEEEGERGDEARSNVEELLKLGIKCNQCEAVISLRNEFITHYAECAQGKKIAFMCALCDKTYSNYHSFKSHCYRHIPNRFKCTYCDKGFSMRITLLSHVAVVHSNERPFVCKVCGKGYASKGPLNIHEKRHQDVGHMCHACGKFVSSQNLLQHLMIHKLEHYFICEICGQRFLSKASIQSHLNNAHTEEKPYSCEKCGKKFAGRYQFQRHWLLHVESSYKCEVCSKSFKTKVYLNNHVRLKHNDIKPFPCPYCMKRFVKKSKLKEHFNVHTGERPFECKSCTRTFTNHANLIKHTRRMHTGGRDKRKEEEKGKSVEEQTDNKRGVVELEDPGTPLPASFLGSEVLSVQAEISNMDQQLSLFDSISFGPDFMCT